MVKSSKKCVKVKSSVSRQKRFEEQVKKYFLAISKELENYEFENSSDITLWEIVNGYKKHQIELPLEEEVFAILKLAKLYPSKVQSSAVNQLIYTFDRLIPSILLLGNSCEF